MSNDGLAVRCERSILTTGVLALHVMTNLAAKIEEGLRRHLSLLGLGEELTPSTEIRQLGLDSVAAVDLLVDLETAFAITFPDEMINWETFQTPSTLENAIRLLIQRNGG